MKDTPLLRIVSEHGDDDLARVFVAELCDGSLIEMVESVQPPIPREDKWVLIVSTLKGCPVNCLICDAGGHFAGKLSASEIFAQIDAMISRRFSNRAVPTAKLKIQFARMGEPAFNDAVLDVLRELPHRYDAPGLIPCISTVAPRGRDAFFETLRAIQRELYFGPHFQLQFSVHTTDDVARKKLIPTATWPLRQIGEYGARFWQQGDRKVTLNFAPICGLPLDAEALANVCDPERFLVKLTPVNPTAAAIRSGVEPLIDPSLPEACHLVAEGFETLLSIGQLRENDIGSNCGMYVGAHLSTAGTAWTKTATPQDREHSMEMLR